MKKLSTIINENFVNRTVSSFDDLISSMKKFDDAKDITATSTFKQVDTIDIESDDMMTKLFTVADIIDCFIILSKHYADERKNISWLDEKIIKSLKTIHYYNNQLASYLSTNHVNQFASINLQLDTLDNNKQLSTFIKQSDEWKELNKLIKSDLILHHQPLTIRAIGLSIITKTKSFIKIIK